MEILGTISAVDSLSGTVIGLVKNLVLEVDRARNDVTTLPAEVENLQEQYEKLSDRVKRVQEANSKLQEVHAANPKLGEAKNIEGDLEKLLKRLKKSLQGDLPQLESLKKEEEGPRSKRAVFRALIGKGAAQVQKQIQKILKRLEDDCRDLDEAIAVRNFTGGVRLEAGVGRVEAGVGLVAAGVDQGFRDVKEMLRKRVPIIQEPQSSGTTLQVLPEYPVAMKERASWLEKEVNSLEDGEVVGIVGMGGIGKTTLAKQVFNNMCEMFVYTSFTDNVKGIEPHELEKRILEKFQGSEGEGSSVSWTDLTDKKTLIVLDDVDHQEQLASVISRRGDFGRGSVIMFTTRNSHLCKRPYIVSFEVPFLKPSEARKLLCKHAFNEKDIPEKLQAQLSKYVEEMVKTCDGLPLSLEVIGRHLYSEDAKLWEGTIRKLIEAQPVDGGGKDSLFATLKVSYDALAKEEQQMFCDIATFFVGERLDVALAAMSTYCVDPLLCWGNLVKRCLVKEIAQLDLDKANFNPANLKFECQQVWMHEHLQDLGKDLARTSFLSGKDEAANKVIEEINSCKKQVETMNLRSISCSRPSDETVLQMSSLAKLTKLQYLRLYDCRHQGASQKFPQNLVLLQWASKFGDDFSRRLQDMKNLAVLELEDRNVSTKDPNAVETSGGFQTGSDESNELSVCPLHLPHSFEGLKILKILRLIGGTRMMELKGLPKSFNKLLSLEVLVLEKVDITHLPDSFGDLSCIKTIVFKWCSELKRLPDSFGNLSSLERLTISNCKKLKVLPNTVGTNLISLKSLVIQGCSKLEQLPPSFSNLSGLHILHCRDTELGKVGNSFQNFSMLQNLQVMQLKLLNENPPPSFSQLSSKTLQYLRLQLKHEVPDGDIEDICWDLSSLEGLTTQGKELTALSKDLGRRVSGDQVNLQFEVNKGSAGTSQQILAMKKIEILRKRGVPRLSERAGMQTFPESIGKLTLLEALTVGGMD